MEEQHPLDLESYFAAVKDPRVERTKRHKLLDIIIIAICGMICGAEGWAEIEEFGKEKEEWLKTILELPNGIPSHDTFGRVFARLDPVQFEACFFEWVQSLTESIEGVIAIDGKTLRRSHDKVNGKKALQRVECVGSRKPSGVSTSSRGEEIKRDHRYSLVITTIISLRMYCDY